MHALTHRQSATRTCRYAPSRSPAVIFFPCPPGPVLSPFTLLAFPSQCHKTHIMDTRSRQRTQSCWHLHQCGHPPPLSALSRCHPVCTLTGDPQTWPLHHPTPGGHPRHCVTSCTLSECHPVCATTGAQQTWASHRHLTRGQPSMCVTSSTSCTFKRCSQCDACSTCGFEVNGSQPSAFSHVFFAQFP